MVGKSTFPFLFSFVADLFQYHASPAFFPGVAAGVALLSKRVGRPLVTGTAALVLVLILCVLSWRQAHMYKNNFALYETTLARNPAAWMARTNLGIALVDSGRALFERGRYADAVDELRAAARLDNTLADVHHGLAAALHALGRAQESDYHAAKARQLQTQAPR